MSSSTSNIGPHDRHKTSFTTKSYEWHATGTAGPETQHSEEKLSGEKDAAKIQTGDTITIVCPICELSFEVKVSNRYMHPQTSVHRLDEIVVVYKTKLCDCPDVTIMPGRVSSSDGS